MAEGSSRLLSLRSIFYLVLLTAVGTGTVYTIDKLVVEPRRVQERLLEAKQKEVERLEKRRRELESLVARLKFTERRAQLVVLDQQRTPDGKVTSSLRFTEIDAAGNPVSQARDLTITGEEVYIDCLVATFEDSFVEQGDPLKGKAVLVFRRIFSNRMEPQNGYMLDREGKAPEVYAAEHAASELEREIWQRFWELADKKEEAQKRGLRSIHGKALYTRLVKDKVYIVQMRATGEIFIGSPSLLKE